MSSSRRRRGGVVALTYWSWNDPLVEVYVLPYLRQIRERLPADERIVLVTTRRGTREAASGFRDELAVLGIESVQLAYTAPGLRSALQWLGLILRLAWIVRRGGLHTVHSWCTPAGCLAWVVSRLSGARLVLDSFEPHAEAMVENGSWKAGGLKHRLLGLFERLQARGAAVAIGTVPEMREYSRQNWGAEPRRFFVKPACVDLELFSPVPSEELEARRAELGLGDARVCVYVGKLGGIYYGREVFEFFAACDRYWDGAFRGLILSRQERDDVEQWRRAAGLRDDAFDMFPVDHREIPLHLQLADFALSPVRPVASKRFCTPIKNGEYWASGLPIVSPPGISVDSDLIRDLDVGVILEGTSEADYLRAIEGVAELLEEKATERQRRIRSVAETQRGFHRAARVYDSIYGAPETALEPRPELERSTMEQAT